MIAITAIFLAAGSIVGLVQASLWVARAPSYKTYKGDGTVAQGWPAVKDWADFETMSVQDKGMNNAFAN